MIKNTYKRIFSQYKANKNRNWAGFKSVPRQHLKRQLSEKD